MANVLFMIAIVFLMNSKQPVGLFTVLIVCWLFVGLINHNRDIGTKQ